MAKRRKKTATPKRAVRRRRSTPKLVVRRMRGNKSSSKFDLNSPLVGTATFFTSLLGASYLRANKKDASGKDTSEKEPFSKSGLMPVLAPLVVGGLGAFALKKQSTAVLTGAVSALVLIGIQSMAKDDVPGDTKKSSFVTNTGLRMAGNELRMNPVQARFLLESAKKLNSMRQAPQYAMSGNPQYAMSGNRTNASDPFNYQ